MKKPGVEIKDSACLFTVWAPEKENMILHLTAPVESEVVMEKTIDGYFIATSEGTGSGTRYFYRPDGTDTPDPASNYQPEGVHGPSEVVDHGRYKWNDVSWKGVPFNDLIIYEIHVGTFSAEGTFEAIIPALHEIAETGINAIEIMPVSQFPGDRNWGYDGVYPYAVQNSYGGPEALKKLIDACHSEGIAVILDVVYNHVGPEGNYLSRFGPYFTENYHVPWGAAVNYDSEYSDGVRDYFSENVIHWFLNYHLDGIRIDAIHMMFDSGAVNFWELVQKKVKKAEQQSGRKFYLIAECDFNSPRITRSPETGGLGFDGQWLDDFHHSLYVLLDKDGKSRYEDFGRIEQLAKAYKEGFVHSGEYVSFRKRKHGASSAGIPGDRFIVFNQNHDQIGNRVNGERLSQLVDHEHMMVASAALLMAPYIPMLFMGEEYGEDKPFYYFVSHTDKGLIKAVREGRKKEFANYKWQSEPPDPQSEETFMSSRIDREKRLSGDYRRLLEWNKFLISFRKKKAALQNFDKDGINIFTHGAPGFMMHRRSEDYLEDVLCLFNLSDSEIEFRVPSALKTMLREVDSASFMTGDNEADTHFPMEIRGDQQVSIKPWSAVIYST
jgi:maltooligosyltrehalose trehalohydrolase